MLVYNIYILLKLLVDLATSAFFNGYSHGSYCIAKEDSRSAFVYSCRMHMSVATVYVLEFYSLRLE